MPEYNKDWFDILSIFSREGVDGQLSVHVFKAGHTCRQFFIPETLMQSPTCFEDIHKLAEAEWEAHPRCSVDGTDTEPCPRCGTTRANWRRYHLGRAFCGFCGMDMPPRPGDKTFSIRIPVK